MLRLPQRETLVFLTGASLLSLGACGCPAVGPCNSKDVMTPRIIGFSESAIDPSVPVASGGYAVDLQVGDAISLYLVVVRENDPLGPRDTVRSVRWQLTDSAAAQISAGGSGAGIFTAVHEGIAGAVIANGGRPDVWACGYLGGCARVSEIRIHPR